MKRTTFTLCLLSFLIACNSNDITPINDTTLPSLNNNPSSESTIPVRLRINGITCKGGVSANETAIKDGRLIVGYQTKGSSQYFDSDTLFFQNSSEIFLNLQNRGDAVEFTVQTGIYQDDKFKTDLEFQQDYFYAVGKRSVTIDALKDTFTPIDIEVTRKINKISIEKISVNWKNAEFNTKVVKLKQIFLCNVPRNNYRDGYEESRAYGYSESFNGTRTDIRYYNCGGIDGAKINYEGINYYVPCYRLDKLLLDNINETISINKPHTVTHTFYAYISASKNKFGKHNQIDPRVGYCAIKKPMTTLALIAEIDGVDNYYQIRVANENSTTDPSNTHIRFRELTITDYGTSSLNSDDSFENIGISFTDWKEEERLQTY